jgi:spermidine synthase
VGSRSGSGSRGRSRGGRGSSRDERRWPGERVERQTPFARAEVIPEPGRPWRRLLRLDGEDCSHVDLRDPRAIDFAYVRRFADLVDLLAPAGQALDVVHLGGGGFTLPRYVAATRPGSRNEVAEIDPGLVTLAREQLGLRTDRLLRVRVADGRELLERRDPGAADLVVLDAFHGTAVPAHLTTAELLAAARRALRPGGLFAANVIDAPPLETSRAVAAGAAEVFDAAAIVATRKVLRGRQGGNVVVLGAAGRALPLAEIGRRALRGGVPELVVGGAELAQWLGGAKPRRDPPPPAAPAAPAAPAPEKLQRCDASPGSGTPPS